MAHGIHHPPGIGDGARSGTLFSVSFSVTLKVASSETRRFEQIWTISDS